MKNELSKIIQGEGFNEIVVDITKYNEISLNCTDGCLDGCYVVLNIEKSKEVIEALNNAIMEVRRREEND